MGHFVILQQNAVKCKWKKWKRKSHNLLWNRKLTLSAIVCDSSHLMFFHWNNYLFFSFVFLVMYIRIYVTYYAVKLMFIALCCYHDELFLCMTLCTFYILIYTSDWIYASEKLLVAFFFQYIKVVSTLKTHLNNFSLVSLSLSFLMALAVASLGQSTCFSIRYFSLFLFCVCRSLSLSAAVHHWELIQFMCCHGVTSLTTGPSAVVLQQWARLPDLLWILCLCFSMQK